MPSQPFSGSSSSSSLVGHFKQDQSSQNDCIVQIIRTVDVARREVGEGLAGDLFEDLSQLFRSVTRFPGVSLKAGRIRRRRCAMARLHEWCRREPGDESPLGVVGDLAVDGVLVLLV